MHTIPEGEELLVKNAGCTKGKGYLAPDMDHAAEAAESVRRIFKMRCPHLDNASSHLLHVYGLEPGLLSEMRAQSVFKHPAMIDLFAEFKMYFLQGRWDVPVAEWESAIEVVRLHEADTLWKQSLRTLDTSRWEERHFYAHFMIRAMEAIQNPKSHTRLLHWIRETELVRGYWVLFHAVMFLQLEAMRDHRRHAPIKDRIQHVLGK
ncbi:hypothetical protein F4778DRAFT_781196 [Xylariomycetidae sp. FL2044]|nr:hypothetical protein F4778DRAFT_781196 [Xylariomycetidae sp. FL2044]